MKKKIIVILIIVGILAVLFTPIPSGVYKDGGTRVYSALTYKIVDWNRISSYGLYEKNSVYFFPNNFRTIDDLWVEEFIENLNFFEATVLAINGDSVLVAPFGDGDGISGIDKVEFGTANLPKLDVKVGSKIKVAYNGQVMYSYPAQINASSWEIIE